MTTKAQLEAVITTHVATNAKLAAYIVKLETELAARASLTQAEPPAPSAALEACKQLMIDSPKHCAGVYVPRTFDTMPITRQRLVFRAMRNKIAQNAGL